MKSPKPLPSWGNRNSRPLSLPLSLPPAPPPASSLRNKPRQSPGGLPPTHLPGRLRRTGQLRPAPPGAPVTSAQGGPAQAPCRSPKAARWAPILPALIPPCVTCQGISFWVPEQRVGGTSVRETAWHHVTQKRSKAQECCLQEECLPSPVGTKGDGTRRETALGSTLGPP